MAEAIRALPAVKDWDLRDAQQWWREFRAEELGPGVTCKSTVAITVDLGGRVLNRT